MVHTNGNGCFLLARVHGFNTTAHGFGHVGARVDGNYEKACKHGAHINIKYAHGTIIHYHGLYNHRRTAENLYIGIQQTLQAANGKLLGRTIIILHGNGLDNAYHETNQAADKGAHHGQH